MELTVPAKVGDVAEMEEILRTRPAINVNWMEARYGFTALHHACVHGHDTIVAILLSHPAIDVNSKTKKGETPFYWACLRGQTSCARLLLKDLRVKVTKPSLFGQKPLVTAASEGRLDLIKWWIASGRELELGGGATGNRWTDAIGAAKNFHVWEGKPLRLQKAKVAALLETFGENPADTRDAVRLEIGWHDELAAEVFAVVIFVSDDLLAVAQGEKARSPAARFFKMASQLPLELQMVLCYRLVGLRKSIIRRQSSEPAFKELARILHVPISKKTPAEHPGSLRRMLQRVSSVF